MKVLQVIFIGTVLLVLKTPKSFCDKLHNDHGSEYIPVQEQPPLKLQSGDRVCKEIDDTLEIILDFWNNDNIQLDDITTKTNQILAEIHDYMNQPNQKPDITRWRIELKVVSLPVYYGTIERKDITIMTLKPLFVEYHTIDKSSRLTVTFNMILSSNPDSDQEFLKYILDKIIIRKFYKDYHRIFVRVMTSDDVHEYCKVELESKRPLEENMICIKSSFQYDIIRLARN